MVSARLGRLMIRQLEDQSARRVAIFLDNRQRREMLSPADLDLQEEAVSEAASLATHYLDRGYSVRLITRTVSLPAGSGQVVVIGVLS